MSNDVISTPLIFRLDEGLKFFDSVSEAESWLEPFDIKSNPSWRGYDSLGLLIRPIISRSERTFLGIKYHREKVSLILNTQISIDNGDEDFRSAMINHLLIYDSIDTVGKNLDEMSCRDIFDLVIAIRKNSERDQE